MRKPVAIVLVLVMVYSCRKETVEASTTLTSHAWSPYQTRIITVDTTTLIFDYGKAKMHSVTSTFRKDTSYNFDPCARQSTYSFSQNGISHITDKCLLGQPATDTPWAIQPIKVLQIVFLEDAAADAYFAGLYQGPWTAIPLYTGFSPVQNGFLTQISASEFVVDQPIGENISTSYYVNGSQVDSVVKMTSDRYISFRSQ